MDDDLNLSEEIALLRQDISEKLREGGEYWIMIVMARANIAKAKHDNDEIAAARAAAQYGAVVKRWRRYLILNLTQIGLDPENVGREFVRAWQKRLFGQAVASTSLSLFSKSDRSGGGRAANITPLEAVEKRLSRFYDANKDRVKACKKPA